MDFYYKCGIMDHDYRICKASSVAVVSKWGVTVPLFRPWLRATINIPSCFHNRSAGAQVE